MGCSLSAPVSRLSTAEKRKPIAVPDEPSPPRPPTPPPIKLSVGEYVHAVRPTDQNIIFMFGGPGSQKGFLAEELTSKMGFTLISTEEVVLTYLPNKVSNAVETTQEIQDLLRMDPDLLTLDWVLHLITARLSTSVGRRFIVDIVPNLLCIQRSSSFTKADYSPQLADFERKFPVLFALNFAVPLEENAIIPQKDEKKDKDKEVKGVSDEIDNERMRRRNESYLETATPYMQYFENEKRLVTFEVQPNSRERVWTALDRFMQIQGFSPHQHTTTHSVLFYTATDNVWEQYSAFLLLFMSTRDWGIFEDEAMDMLRREVTSKQSLVAIHLDCLDYMPSQGRNRHISFLELGRSDLETVLGPGHRRKPLRPYPNAFHTISSTSDPICLFPLQLSGMDVNSFNSLRTGEPSLLDTRHSLDITPVSD